jgi:hypothetical protein
MTTMLECRVSVSAPSAGMWAMLVTQFGNDLPVGEPGHGYRMDLQRFLHGTG